MNHQTLNPAMNGTDLMTLYQEGDLEAFNCLYAKYKSMVYGYLYKRVNNRTDVDEIFQDVFLRVHNSRSRYKRELPFEPWLFVILRNSLIDYFRKKGKEHDHAPMDDVMTTPMALQVEDKHNSGRLLPKDIDLKESQRQAIELRYGDDFTFEEIALRLETTSSNARQLVSRAVKKLKKIIKPEDIL